MNGQSSKERERERRKERTNEEKVNDRPVIANRVLMFSLDGNGIVILVSLEIYHRIGSVQTRDSL